MEKFKDYTEFDNEKYRDKIVFNSGISTWKLQEEQEEERPKYNEKEVSSMVSDCFKSITSAASLLASNGLFLKYAGPSIRDNFELVRIACHQNGNAIKYASDRILYDPDMVSTLILSALYGYPCEAYRKVMKDENIILEVSKQIVSKDDNFVAWVEGHMYQNNPPQEFIDSCRSSRNR